VELTRKKVFSIRLLITVFQLLVTSLQEYEVWRLCPICRKGIWPVKNWLVGCWRGYVSGSRCRFAYGPADATATHCFLLRWIQIGFYLPRFTFLVPAHLGSPGLNPRGP